MRPNLFDLFGEPVPAYFAMLVFGFAVATWMGVRWAKRTGLDHEVIIDLGLGALIAGIVGARILHVLADGYFWDYVHLCTDPGQVVWKINRAQCTAAEGVWDSARGVCRPGARDCFAWAAFWRGGLTYYGGLAAAFAYGIHLLRKERFPLPKALDMVGVTIPVGLFFARMGCFLGGCCFGTISSSRFAMSFPRWSPASEAQFRSGLLRDPSMPSLPVHPTQLYEALGSLVLAGLSLLVLHPRKRFDGQVFCVYLAGYAALRFCLEFLRADDRGGAIGLSTSQWISLALLPAAAVLWARLSKRRNQILLELPS